MRLWCLDDTGKAFRTGRNIRQRALNRGWDCRLFSEAHEVDSGHAFMRIAQYPPEIVLNKNTATELAGRPEVTLIPTYRQMMWYEDKILQARDLAEYLPETRVVYNRDSAMDALDALGLPLVSKATVGSGSHNVRYVTTKAEALAEIDAAFGGEGLKIVLGAAGRGMRQKGYLLWQKFLAGNDYMYRVGVVGRFGWIFRAHNNPKTGKASGYRDGGEPVMKLNDETRAVWSMVRDFARETGETYCGLDVVRDPATGQWRILETTLAWGMQNRTTTSGTMIFAETGDATGRLGADLWETMLDEVEAGAFAPC